MFGQVRRRVAAWPRSGQAQAPYGRGGKGCKPKSQPVALGPNRVSPASAWPGSYRARNSRYQWPLDFQRRSSVLKST